MASTRLIELTDGNFGDQVLGSAQPVLIDFGAAWCPPCRAIAPVVEALAAEYDGKMRVAMCDVDRSPDLANRLDVRSVPTLIVFRDGRVVARMVGAAARDRIRRFVTEALPCP